MKKSVQLVLGLLFCGISFYSYSQTELWGMTSKGGNSNGGVIFKTGENGENLNVEFSFPKNEGSTPQYTKLCEVNGKLYGMTKDGGPGYVERGLIFEFDIQTNNYKSKFYFDYDENGYSPMGSLIASSNGTMYGMLMAGGINGGGAIFEFNPVNESLNIIFDFDELDGKLPHGGLLQASNGKLYGMTRYGGVYDKGVIFEFDVQTSVFNKIEDFNDDIGSSPLGDLIEPQNGIIYGMTYSGGEAMDGVIFKYDIEQDTLTKVFDFEDELGSSPYGSLFKADNEKLYGMTKSGGQNGNGVIFEFNYQNESFQKVHDFDDDSKNPEGSLIQASNGLLYGMTSDEYKDVLFSFDIENSTMSVEFEFYGLDGRIPKGTVVQATNGILYGVTSEGGRANNGVLFQYDTETHNYQKIIDFNYGEIGCHPYGSLFAANDGLLYGMTLQGGLEDRGVIFNFNKETKTYTKLYDFEFQSGFSPSGSLLQATNGLLYGMASLGNGGRGSLFSFDPLQATFTKILDFNQWDFPQGSLIQSTNGNLYGMTKGFSTTNYFGYIFHYNILQDTLTIDFNFNDESGKHPYGDLLEYSNGIFYGLTSDGGTYYNGVLFEYNSITNTYLKKWEFDIGDGGINPLGSLIKASDGKLYGITSHGSWPVEGSIFNYDPGTGNFQELFEINDSELGGSAQGSLLQTSNGKLYGLTRWGGSNLIGVLFEFDLENNLYTKKFDFDNIHGANPEYTHLIEVSNVGAIENSSLDNVNIFPNPSSKLLNIELAQFDSNIKIKISDSYGKELKNFLYHYKQSLQIDISDLIIGFYYLEVQSGKLSTKLKFIKK